jgi:hypothetical protein
MPRLTPPWILHLQDGVSYRLGSSTADGRPEISRALAAQALPDGRIEVLLNPQIGAALLRAVEATRRIAFIAAQPGSNRTLHVKGRDAELFAPGTAHQETFERCRDRFIARVEPFGFQRQVLLDMMYDLGATQLQGLRFTPTGAWDQTPGIGAVATVELLP